MSDSLRPHGLQHAGLPVHRQLLEFTQTHAHWVGDAIQPSHPLLSPSPPTFNLSQHQDLWNESVLCSRWPKYWSFSFSISLSSENQDWLPLGWTGWISLQSKGLSSSPTPQFKSINALVLSFLYSSTLNPYMTTGKTKAFTRWTLLAKYVSAF